MIRTHYIKEFKRMVSKKKNEFFQKTHDWVNGKDVIRNQFSFLEMGIDSIADEYQKERENKNPLDEFIKVTSEIEFISIY